MNNEILLVIMSLLFVVSMIIILVIVLNNSKKTNDLNNELSKSIFEIRNSLNKDFIAFNKNLNDDFNSFSERVNSNLIQSNKYHNDIYNNISEKMARIDEAQKGLNELSKDLVSLQDILTDKKTRGTFGEVELYSLLEASYGTDSNFFGKQYTLSNGKKADAVVFGPDKFNLICIDSKFPLENYRRMYDNELDDKTREIARRQFGEDVKKHLNDIHDKYIIPGETADLAYMFIPAESIYSEIYANFQNMVNLSYNLKVYIVSPTTLMAYLTAIKSIYLGQKKDEKAKEIEQLLAELSIEFKRFDKRSSEVAKAYDDLKDDFRELSITSEKIIKKFSKINNGEIEKETE